MTGAPIDLLYRLSRRDQAFPHWGPNAGRIRTPLGSESVSTTIEEWDALRPPDGTILFITNLAVAAIPGTGLSTTETRVEMRNRTTDVIVARLIDIDAIPNVANPDQLKTQSPMDFAIISDRFYLKALGGFTLGAALNRVDFSWVGYTVPRGELGFI